MSETPISIVGVGGLLTSGKDAFADHLVEHYDYAKTYMSEPLHQWMMTQNPWIKLDERIWCMEGHYWEPGEFHTYNEIVQQVGYTEAKKQREIRIALQRIGTDCGRTIVGEDVWVQAMERSVQRLIDGGERNIVITGIRYENELLAIRRLGGETVWIERPSAREAHEKKIRNADSTATHTSEITLDHQSFDSVIINDGSLLDLFDATGQWVYTHRSVVARA